jgi:type IV secretion system protein VirB1
MREVYFNLIRSIAKCNGVDVMSKELKLAVLILLVVPVTRCAAGELSPQVLTLARRCAPNIDALTMAYLVSTESEGNPLAINVNDYRHQHLHPMTEGAAREAIRWLEKQGMNYDVGYAQINSANFRRLELTGVQLLDGCTNLRAAAQILGECYRRAVGAVGEGQTALRRALSCYNTGSQHRGFTNGYVARVVAKVRLKVPALLDGPFEVNGPATDRGSRINTGASQNLRSQIDVIGPPSFGGTANTNATSTPPMGNQGRGVCFTESVADAKRVMQHVERPSATNTLARMGEQASITRSGASVLRNAQVEVYRAYIPPGEMQ